MLLAGTLVGLVSQSIYKWLWDVVWLPYNMVVVFQPPQAFQEKETGGSCIPFSNTALEQQCHFCHIIFIKVVTKIWLSSRGRNIDFTSCKGVTRFWKSSLNQKYHCSHFGKTIFHHRFVIYLVPKYMIGIDVLSNWKHPILVPKWMNLLQ